MAANIQFRNYIRNTLNITEHVATVIVDNQHADNVEFYGNKTSKEILNLLDANNELPHPMAGQNGHPPNEKIRLDVVDRDTIMELSKYAKYIALVQRDHSPQLGTAANLKIIA